MLTLVKNKNFEHRDSHRGQGSTVTNCSNNLENTSLNKRTCLSCRSKFDKNQLIILVQYNNHLAFLGTVGADLKQVKLFAKEQRYYLCHSCLVKPKKGFKKSLNLKSFKHVFSDLKTKAEENIYKNLGLARRHGFILVGEQIKNVFKQNADKSADKKTSLQWIIQANDLSPNSKMNISKESITQVLDFGTKKLLGKHLGLGLVGLVGISTKKNNNTLKKLEYWINIWTLLSSEVSAQEKKENE